MAQSSHPRELPGIMGLTLVFDPRERPPVLVAAVYDQWEW
jgi:hypothetical protein